MTHRRFAAPPHDLFPLSHTHTTHPRSNDDGGDHFFVRMGRTAKYLRTVRKLRTQLRQWQHGAWYDLPEV